MNIYDKKLKDIFLNSESRDQIWIKFIDLIEAKNIAEIGVWKGEFAKEVLWQSKGIQRYYMIDPWQHLPDWNKPWNVKAEMFDEIYKEAVSNTSFASDKTIILRGSTKDIIDEIPDESLDFAYIDGDHTLRGITIDLHKVLPKIKPNGFIGGDDFVNTPWQHDMSYEPTLVCPYSVYFAEAQNIPIVCMPHNQFIIQKSASDMFSFTDLTDSYSDLSLNKFPEKKQAGGLKGIIKNILR